MGNANVTQQQPPPPDLKTEVRKRKALAAARAEDEASPPPPPKPKEYMVVVPPLFEYPPTIPVRTRMSVPAYELMFGKVSRHNLFEGYLDQAGKITSGVMLKPLEDPHFDFTATVSAATDKNCGSQVKGDATLRWQKKLDDPNNFVDLIVSTSNLMWQLRSCVYYPQYHIYLCYWETDRLQSICKSCMVLLDSFTPISIYLL